MNSNESSLMNSNSSCIGLRILDIPRHHPCFHWEFNAFDCEREWPCEVRQYLLTISPLISLTQALLSYGTVIIIILGLLLNSLSFYTFLSSGLSKSGSGIYLISLAICDSGNLITNYAVGVARGHIKEFNLYFMEHEFICRLHAVFVELFQMISAWIVVSFTVERCTAVWYPMWLRNTSRKKRARNAVTIVATVFSLFALTKLFLTGFERDSVFGYAPCHSHRYKWHGIAYVRVAFQTWIPTILVFIFNCLMFYKIRKMKKARKRLTEYKPADKGGKPKFNEGSRKPSFINRPSPTAPMLVAVSLAYLVLVFPLGVVQTIELFWTVHHPHPPVIDDYELQQKYIKWKTTKLLLKYIRSLCFSCYQINYAINFFLYFAAGLQFRLHLQHKIKVFFHRFRQRVSCCRKKEVLSKQESNATQITAFSISSNNQKGSNRSSSNRERSRNESTCPSPTTPVIMHNRNDRATGDTSLAGYGAPIQSPNGISESPSSESGSNKFPYSSEQLQVVSIHAEETGIGEDMMSSESTEGIALTSLNISPNLQPDPGKSPYDI